MAKIDRLVETSLAIENEDAQTAGAIGFTARALVQATMPHSKPQGLVHERKNGSLTLTMIGSPTAGLPYGGLPRLLLAWLTTEAVRTREPRILLGDNLSAFMAGLDLSPTGGSHGTIGRLRDQMKRLFTCAVFVTEATPTKDAGLSLTVADDYRLWWHPKAPEQGTLWESHVTLGRRFFDEITATPVPVDTRVLRALRRSPLGLDLYLWLSWRTFNLRRPLTLPWAALAQQFGASYADTKQGRHDFRRNVRLQLTTLRTVWGGLRAELGDVGMTLRPTAPLVSRRRGPSPC